MGLPRSGLLALLFALLLRAGVPAGYMIAPTDGGLRIVPCSGVAPLLPHQGGHRHRAPAGELPCAFALTAPPALPEAPPILAPPPVFAAAMPVPPLAAANPRPSAILHPPATGPPFA